MMTMECTICCDLLSNPAEDRCVHQLLRFSRPLRRSRTAFLQSYSLTDLSYIPCGHQFHTRCLQNWFMSSDIPTCPNCRAKTSFLKIQQISQSNLMNPAVSIKDDTKKMNQTKNNSSHSIHRQEPFLDIILASLRAHVYGGN